MLPTKTFSKILREKLSIQNPHSNGHLTSFDVWSREVKRLKCALALTHTYMCVKFARKSVASVCRLVYSAHKLHHAHKFNLVTCERAN